MNIYKWSCLNSPHKDHCDSSSREWSPHRDYVVRKAMDHEKRTGHKTIVWGRTKRTPLGEYGPFGVGRKEQRLLRLRMNGT